MCDHPSVIVHPYRMAWATVCTGCGYIVRAGSRMDCEATAERWWPGRWSSGKWPEAWSRMGAVE